MQTQFAKVEHTIWICRVEKGRCRALTREVMSPVCASFRRSSALLSIRGQRAQQSESLDAENTSVGRRTHAGFRNRRSYAAA